MPTAALPLRALCRFTAAALTSLMQESPCVILRWDADGPYFETALRALGTEQPLRVRGALIGPPPLPFAAAQVEMVMDLSDGIVDWDAGAGTVTQDLLLRVTERGAWTKCAFSADEWALVHAAHPLTTA